MKYLESIHDVLPRYEGFLIDLWGVIHDGAMAYPGVDEVLRLIQSSGKRAVLLSNAPRRIAQTIANMEDMGITRESYHNIVTSGEVTYQYISDKRRNKKCYFIGSGYDKALLQHMPVRLTEQPDDADFILVAAHYYENQPLYELKEALETMCWLDVPMICANPDTHIITQDGSVYRCAGDIGNYYRDIGGQTHFVGKPYPTVYAKASELLDMPLDGSVLAIGDNMETDIRGADSQGIDSLLITGGIASGEIHDAQDRVIPENFSKLTDRYSFNPTYYMEYIGKGIA